MTTKTVYCSTPKGVRLNKTQLDEILTMPEEQFQEWCLTLEKLRYMADRGRAMRDKVEATYGRFR